MDELKQKVEALLKGLLSVKEQQGPFVPAVKPPTLNSPKSISAAPTSALAPLKPIGVESVSATPTKIAGGLPPPSKKDPAKVAEQLKNPRPQKAPVEVLKVEENGQWALEKAGFSWPPTTKARAAVSNVPTTPIKAAEHGFHTHSPAQNALVDGLTLHNSTPMGSGNNGAALASSVSHKNQAIVKNSAHHDAPKERGHLRNNFNSARREVLYHDLAHGFFGMGKYVPTTAGFTVNGHDWSAQQKVGGAEHPEFATPAGDDELAFETQDVKPKAGGAFLKHPNHERVLRNLNNNGELDKMAIMDHLMGHHDRHSGNFMIDKVGNRFHLIDNGSAFDYGNQDGHPNPWYRTFTQELNLHGPGGHDSRVAFHPEAVKWLNNLDPQEAAKIFSAHKHGADSPAIKGFVGRLQHLKDSVNHPRGFLTKPDQHLVNGKKATHQKPEEYT